MTQNSNLFATDDSAITDEDVTVDVQVLDNDSRFLGAPGIVTFTQGAHGSVTLDDNGTPGDGTDDSLVYTPDSEVSGFDTFTYTVTAGGTTETATVGITINAVDDAPEFISLDDRPSYVEDSGRILLDPNAVINDVDHTGSYEGATLTLVRSTGANSDDSFGASLGGQPGQVTFDEGTVYFNDNYNWVPIGQVVNADGTLAITFNASATGALVNAVLQQITYANGSESPTGPITIDYTFDDGKSTTGSITMDVTATNDAPDLEGVTGGVLFTAGDAPQAIGSAVTVTDADTATLASATVTIANFQTGDVLDADTTGTSIQLSFTNGILTLTGSDTVEHYQQVLSTVTYQSTLADPTLDGSALDRQISWVLDDGQGGNNQSATETTMISFVPTVDSDASGAGTGFATTYTENGTGIAIVDADIAITGGSNGLNSAQIVITDAIDGDSLEVGTLPGSITASVDTSTSGQITVNLSGGGSAADYQQALQAITFQSTSDAPGDSRTIEITVSDGLSSSAVAATTIAITGVNDVHTGGGSITGTATENQILTAVSTLADVDGIGSLHYDWQRNTGNGFVHTGAADQAIYTLGDDDVGGTVQVTISYTDSQGFTEEVTTDVTGVVGAVNDPALGNVSITGTATEDQVLTADTSQVVDFDGLGTMHFDWQRDTGSGYVSMGAADQATYTLDDADVGSTVRVVVSYTDSQGFSERVNGGATATIAGVNDPLTGDVSINGTATEDQTLTADTSTLSDFDGLGTLHFDWQRDSGSGFVSTGASDQSTYTLSDTDVGGTVRVVVSYTDGQGFAETITSSATGTIANVDDDPTGTVTIAGTATEDEVLTADTSSLADADGLGTLHFQWQRDAGSGYVNVGSDQATYMLGDADVGGAIRVVTSYTDGQGATESVTSTATATIEGVNDPHSGGVSISGTATENQTLTADTSSLNDADGLGTLHYDWQRNSGSGFVSTGAADQSTYTLGDADVGGTVQVVISYTDGQGFSESATSAATAIIANVNDDPTGSASISGTAAEDQVLTADASTLADADGLGTLHYQWQRDTGSGYVNVGTDQTTYTLGDSDIGGVVRVIVSYTDAGGTAESVTSAATGTVDASNDAPTGDVSITGTTTEDQVLTADTSALADVDGLGTLHYDWQRDTGSGFVSIGAADQATYTLDDTDVGGSIRVVTSYTDGQGFTGNVTSASTAAIAAVNDPQTGDVAVTGTAAEDQVLTADVSALADADGLGTLHYDWQRNTGSGFVSIGAADQATYTLDDADVGGVVRVVVSYTDGQGFSETATSTTTAAIANVNDAPTGAVSITGTTTENQVLTADTSTLTDSDGLGTLHYDWQRDTGSGFVSIGAADQATYTLDDADVGGVVRVVTSYTDGQGTTEALTSTATAAIAGINDTPTGAVSITGTATEDQVLTADTSTLADTDGLGTLHYDWQRDTGDGFVSIGAADQATYTLDDADVGGVVRVVTSYTDGQGTVEALTTAATAAIGGISDPHAGGVSITGTATEDQVLTADTSTLADADGLGTLHYQWQRDTGSGFVSIDAADQATYTLDDTNVGGSIRVVISYTDGQGFAETATSAATAAIANANDAPTGAVSITGTTTEDRVLTADTSALADTDGLGTLHYQWQRDSGSGFINVGADQATYTLDDADVGGVIRVVTSYTDGQGTAEAVTSAATATIDATNDAPTGGVSITGTATEDQTLTANSSTLADTDGLGTLHYQWQRDSGLGYVNVGVDQAAYTLGDADVGGMIRVVTSYTDLQGTAETTTSDSTAAIAGVNDTPVGSVSITGAATEDQVLTADSSTLIDADGLGTLHYDWQRDTGAGFVSIGAADQATYTLGDADVGGMIRVVTSYTDLQGTAETLTSDSTAAIAGVNDTPVGSVSITGAATEDQVLTADSSTLIDADGLGTLHYDWQRDTGAGFVSIGAADQATYTLGDADVGGMIRVVTSYTDLQGTAETLTSASTAAVVEANDAPVLTGDLQAAVNEGGLYTLTAADIGFTDPDDSAADIVFSVSGMVNGTLRIAGKAATSFTAADLDAGKVKFRHDGSETVDASFQVLVEDGNEDVSTPVASSFDFTVTPMNDVPALEVDQRLNAIAENASTADARKVAVLAISDADGGDNTLSLAGEDAKLFEIKNDALWLKAGAKLDFEQNPDLDVTVRLRDPTLGTGYVDSQDLSLAVKDVVEQIRGTSKSDRLDGAASADQISGLAGNDTLHGRGGDDRLSGGKGIDKLYGEGGADTFVFAQGDSGRAHAKADTIHDFKSGQGDMIDLSAIDAIAKSTKDDGFDFIGKDAFSGTAGELRFDKEKSNSWIEGDTNGDGKADFTIHLDDAVVLTETNFML